MASLRMRGAGLLLISALALAAGCGGGGGGDGVTGGSIGPACSPISSTSVLLSWAANRESAVNRAGGGYRVYRGTTPRFDIATAMFDDVAWVSGPTAPTSRIIPGLSSGSHYFKVVAFSTLTPPGGTGGSTSAPSGEVCVIVP